MKVVLHIGDGRSGSTSVQEAFYLSREALLSQSILVPTNHGKKIRPFDLANLFWDAASTPASAALNDHISDQIFDNDPDIVFLSSEHMWRFPDAIPQVRTVLNRWSEDIELIAYLREPRSLYRSELQQILKASSEIPSPHNWEVGYADQFRQWSAAFGDRLTVVPYEPERLNDGSVVRDIAARTCPDALNTGLLVDVPNVVSDSAEVSALVQEYLAEHYSHGPRAFRPDAQALRQALLRLSETLGIGSKAELTPSAAETILAIQADDLLAMQNEFGFQFSDIPYDRLQNMHPDKSLRNAQWFSDICIIDESVKRRLTMQYLGQVVPHRD